MPLPPAYVAFPWMSPWEAGGGPQGRVGHNPGHSASSGTPTSAREAAQPQPVLLFLHLPLSLSLTVQETTRNIRQVNYRMTVCTISVDLEQVKGGREKEQSQAGREKNRENQCLFGLVGSLLA